MASNRLVFLIALGLAVGFALPAPAPAADGLQITPSRIDERVTRGDELPPVRVVNRSPRAVTVRATALRAGQELSGLPSFAMTPQAVREGRGFLEVSPERFRLAPGESRNLRARVTGGPVRGRGAYGVILVDGRMSEQGEGSVVTPVVRLAANILLEYPGRGSARGAISDLRAAQAGPRQIDVVTRMRNTGRIHATPAATLTIRDARGRVVVNEPVPSGNVLPRFERELPLRLPKVLPAGDYEARVVARLGRQRSSRTLDFTLVGPNELPTPRLEIVELPSPSPEPGEEFRAAVRVRNAGTAPVDATAQFTVGPVGGEPVTRESVELADLRPGEATTVEQALAGLAEGEHELAVRFREGDRVVAERSLVFSATEGPSWTTRVLDWLAANLVVVLAAVVALIVGLALFAAARIRRLQRRLREQTARG